VSSGAKGLRWVVSRLLSPEVIEERNRMAGEIHDTLAQEFAGILLHLEAANGLDGAVNASESLGQSEGARQIWLGRRSQDAPGAAAKVARRRAVCATHSVQLAERFSREVGINCTFGASGNGSHQLSEEIENELYRVAQEALVTCEALACRLCRHFAELQIQRSRAGDQRQRAGVCD